jgi:hypothetical protein
LTAIKNLNIGKIDYQKKAQMKTLQDLKQTLISKNPFKRFQTSVTNSSRSSGNSSATSSGNTSSKNKLFEMDINIDYNEGQSFLSTYIGNTVISFDTNEGNASKYISKIIEIVNHCFIHEKNGSLLF